MIHHLTVVQPEHAVPSENWMKSAHHMVAYKRMQPWKEVAYYAWKEERHGPIAAITHQPCIVMVEIGFHRRRRRDPHNYVGTVCKSLIDGLVLAGVWPDDTAEWVTLREPVLTVHPNLPATQLLPCIIHFKVRSQDGEASARV